MLYALGFIGLFTIGGVTGLVVATLAVDVHLHDTYFVVAHFHTIMVGATLMAYLGGLHFWWPKMFGRMYSEFWARISAILVFVGFNLTFFPQFVLGYMGMPRRYHMYPDEFQVLNVLSSGGAAVLDQETRLLWEAAPTMTGVQYPTASAACAGKTLAGLGGWRLPSQEELWTLLDRHVTSGPKLPAGHPFVGIQVGDYWTRTPQPNGSDMLTQDLGSGQSGHMSQMGGQLIGWCVRPEP